MAADPKVDYQCPECKAQATVIPDPDAKPGQKSGRVMVPHGPSCSVGRRVEKLRMRGHDQKG